MKLRLFRNAVRLRLGPAEVRRLIEFGRIEEVTAFGPETSHRLRYALELSDDATEPRASLDGTYLVVHLPRAAARQWADGEAVAIAGEQPVGGSAAGGEALRILVEKDFACLDQAAAVDEPADTFPHPNEGGACPPER